MTGQFVTSKAGHDKGTLYVVVAERDEFLFLADGRLKKPDNPKKKSRKHVQPVNVTVDKKLLEKLEAGESVRPEEIRFAIRQYTENQSSKK